MNNPTATNAKQAALTLIGALPESVNWDEVVYEPAVRRATERGLAEVEAGRFVDASDIERELFAP